MPCKWGILMPSFLECPTFFQTIMSTGKELTSVSWTALDTQRLYLGSRGLGNGHWPSPAPGLQSDTEQLGCLPSSGPKPSPPGRENRATNKKSKNWDFYALSLKFGSKYTQRTRQLVLEKGQLLLRKKNSNKNKLVYLVHHNAGIEHPMRR